MDVIESKILCTCVGLRDFLGMLDKRYANKAQKVGGQMAKKNRKIGTCSTAPPPFGTPTWMIDASFYLIFVTLLDCQFTACRC